MGLDLEQMRNDLRTATGMDEDDLPDPSADVLLNRSYWELIGKFQFREKEQTDTFPTVAGVRNYGLPTTFDALRKLSALEPDSQDHKVIDRATIDWYEQNYNEKEENRGFPERYVRDGACQIRLWPTPDGIYTITIKYWTTLNDITEGNAPEIPQAWHEIIYLGGLWRAFIQIGDFIRTRECKNHQISLINSMVPVEAKEEYDSHRAGVAPIIREYDV